MSYVVPVKSKMEISQKFVAFSECMNFKPPVLVRKKMFFATHYSEQWYEIPRKLHMIEGLPVSETLDELVTFFLFVHVSLT